MVEVHRDWALNGADRFYNLVKNGFYNDARFFRVIEGFMVQFGINGDPKISAVWQDANIPDDPVKQSNERGMITFATAGPNTRTTQVFINFGDNASLDGQGFCALRQGGLGHGRCRFALQPVMARARPRVAAPTRASFRAWAIAYLEKAFPKLDFIKKATIEP